MTTALHNVLTFNPKSKDRVGDLTSRLSAIGRAMEGFRSSFEYIQDYINIPGLRLWQEEISRIVNHAVEKEAAGFLKGSGESYSQYQSVAVPIPEFPPGHGDLSRFELLLSITMSGDTKCRTFMGRVARELLAVSEMSQAALVPALGAWYSVRTPHAEVALTQAVGEACDHFACILRCLAPV